MTKNKKIVVSVAVAVIVVVLVAVLAWGLQGVKDESVTYEELKEKLSDRLSIPTELPFEGETECLITYPKGDGFAKLVRFQKNLKIAGYIIKVTDGDKVCTVQRAISNIYRTGLDTSQEYNDIIDSEIPIKGSYKDIEVYYNVDENTKVVKLYCNGYILTFDYPNSSEITADAEKLLDDMFIK